MLDGPRATSRNVSHLDEADDALRRYDNDVAVGGYKNAYKEGRSDRALAGLVRAHWQGRHWGIARKALDELAGHSTVHAELARGLVALGQPDRAWWLGVDHGSAKRDTEAAIVAFTAAITADSANAEAHAGHATAVRMAGSRHEAREQLEALDDLVRLTAPVQLELAISAFEDDEFERAADHAHRALELDPGSVRAELVIVEIARHMDGEAAVGMAMDLARRCPMRTVVEQQGWVLFDKADKSHRSQDGKQLLADTLTAFTRATPPQGIRPGVVSGRVAVLVASGSMQEARHDIMRALDEEPDSPELHRCSADVVAATTWKVAARLEAYQRVLDFDPRDVRARLAAVDALVKLGRVEEAKQAVTALHAELPGNGRVMKAWTSLAIPWRMPEPDEIRTRIVRPWENGRDERDAVVEVLVDEIVENLSLQPAVTDRIHHRVSRDAAVYRPALEEEQAYLRARQEYSAARDQPSRRSLRNIVLAGCVLIIPFAGAGLLAAIAEHGHARVEDITGLFAGVVIVMGALIASSVLILGRHLAPKDDEAQRAFDVWLESLYGNGLLPIAAEATSVDITYRTSLPVHSRIVSNSVVELDTPATRELRRLLRQRGKGSFALAGPRGAGKSTLLDRWCAGHFLREDDDPRTARHDLTVRVDAPVGYQSQEFLHHLFGQVCDAVEKYARAHKPPAPPGSRWFTRAPAAPLDSASGSLTVSAATLELLAMRERENIRYVQTRTTEGEWALGVPPIAGTTLGIRGKVAVQRSDVPLNHPELVTRFREFLRTAADVVATHKGKVLIGIDELDRISDGAEAQRFINELKAVFTVPDCYFLVSVSEDALADFELSAMGMRTVFDSAFDTIVRVDYLTFPLARTLLSRRIIDLPEQFAALAYVLSGGLARELTRVAEEIGDERTENRTLRAMTAYLVSRQLARTTRAAADRLSRVTDRRASATLIPVLDEQHRQDLTGDLLRSYADRVATIGTPTEEPDDVATIRLDVVVMITYLAVLLDIFNDTLTEARMSTGPTPGHGDFETLARVRRYLGANPYGALELLAAFTKAWDLAIDPTPIADQAT